MVLRRSELLRLGVELAKQMTVHMVPSVAAAARACGIPYATAWRALQRFDLKIRAIPCYPALDLKPVFVLAEGGREGAVKCAKRLTYAKYASVAYPGNLTFLLLTPPPDLVRECLEAVEELAGPVVDYWEMERALIPTPVPELLDDLGGLDLSRIPSEVQAPRPVEPARFDAADLSILAKLEAGWTYPRELREGLGLTRGTVAYRLRRRIPHMIEGFSASLWIWDWHSAPRTVFLGGGDLPGFLAHMPTPTTVFVGDGVWCVSLQLPCFLRMPVLRRLPRAVREYVLDPELFLSYSVPVRAWTELSLIHI